MISIYTTIDTYVCEFVLGNANRATREVMHRRALGRLSFVFIVWQQKKTPKESECLMAAFVLFTNNSSLCQLFFIESRKEESMCVCMREWERERVCGRPERSSSGCVIIAFMPTNEILAHRKSVRFRLSRKDFCIISLAGKIASIAHHGEERRSLPSRTSRNIPHSNLASARKEGKQTSRRPTRASNISIICKVYSYLSKKADSDGEEEQIGCIQLTRASIFA